MSNQSDTRQVTSLRTGTKICLIIAPCLLAVAVYYFVTPVHFMGKDGGIFGCGSAMSPNDNQLGRSQCQIIEGVSRNKALLFLAMALFTALLGFLFFGTDKAHQARIDRDELDDEDADDDVRRDARDERDDERDVKRPGRRSSLLAGRGERERLEDDDEPKPRARPARTRRLGDEDEPPEDRDRVRHSRRLDEDDEPREPRRRTGGRYDDDAFDSVRD